MTDPTNEICSLASISTATISTTRKSRISNNALRLISGTLKRRLNKICDHWPASTPKRYIKKSNCELRYGLHTSGNIVMLNIASVVRSVSTRIIAIRCFTQCGI